MNVRTHLSRMERIFGLTWIVLGISLLLHLFWTHQQVQLHSAQPEIALHYAQREPFIGLLSLAFFVLAFFLFIGWRRVVNAVSFMIVLPAAALLGALAATALAVVAFLAVVFIGGGDGDEIVNIVAPSH